MAKPLRVDSGSMPGSIARTPKPETDTRSASVAMPTVTEVFRQRPAQRLLDSATPSSRSPNSPTVQQCATAPPQVVPRHGPETNALTGHVQPRIAAVHCCS